MDIPPPLPPSHQVAQHRVKPDKPRSGRFQLHLVSKILIGVSVLLSLLATYQEAREHDPNSGYMIGYFVGSLISPFVLPLLLGWLSWRLAGKRLWAGNVVFSVILGLTCLGQLAGMANARRPAPQSPEAAALDRRLEELHTVGKNIAASNEERVQVIDNLAKGFDDCAQSTTNERDALDLRVGAEYMRQLNAKLSAFIQAQQAFITDDSVSLAVDDYTDPSQFVHARAVTQAYGQSCRDVLDFYTNTKMVLAPLYKKEGLSSTEAAQSAARLASAITPQKLERIDLIYGTHNDYAVTIDKILKLLHDNWGKWQYDADDETVYFDSDDTLATYDQLVDRIIWLEERLDTITAKAAQEQ